MRGKIKFLTGLFICLIAVCEWRLNVYAAAPSLTASADAAGAAPGDAVHISIDLNGNPGLLTLGMALKYDSSILEYISTNWSGSFSDNDMKMVSDTGDEINLSVVCEESYTLDETVATVCFKAVQDTLSIPVTLELREMADADLEPVLDCNAEGTVKLPVEKEVNTEKENDQPAESDNEKNNNKNNGQSVGTDAQEEEKQSAERDHKKDNMVSDTEEADTILLEDMKGEYHASGQNGSTEEIQQVENIAGTTANQNLRSSSQDIQSFLVSDDTEKENADENYKTGGIIGNDIFLILSAICGISVLMILVKRGKGEDV